MTFQSSISVTIVRIFGKFESVEIFMSASVTVIDIFSEIGQQLSLCDLGPQ